MRFGLPQDLARGAGIYQRLEDEAVRGVFGTRGELAVGKRARAAQAKLDVAL